MKTILAVAALLCGLLLAPPVLAQAVYPTALTPDTSPLDSDVFPVWKVADTRAKRTSLGAIRNGIGGQYLATYYGAVCDGATDDTIAFAAAITAMPTAGGSLLLPNGATCVISSLTLGKAILLRGAGGSTIKTNSATADVFTITSFGVVISDVTIDSTVTRTAGAYVKSAVGFTLLRFGMRHQFVGVDITGGSGHRISFGSIRNGVTGVGSAGIKVESGSDTYLHQITMDGTAPYPAAGIWITGTGDVNMTDLDIIHQTDDLLITGGFSIWAVDSFFDTATHGIHIVPATPMGRTRFVGCWTSSHSGDGVLIEPGASTAVDISFVGHHAFFNGGNGVTLTTGGGFSFTAGQVQANAAAGFSIGAGISDYSITSSTIGSTTATNGNAGNGTYGIVFAAGTSNSVVIANNRLTGNISGATSGAPSGSNNVVATNSPTSVNTLVMNHSQLPPLVSGDIPNNAANTSGLAATATALASTPTPCSTGSAPTGVNASGNSVGCAALAANTTATGSQWFTAYNSTTGAFTKTQPTFADLPGLLPTSQMPTILYSSGSDTASISTATPSFLVTRTDADATSPGFSCIKNRSGGSVAASDAICTWSAQASNSTPSNLNFGQLVWTAIVPTAGSESARLEVKQRTGTGSLGTTWTWSEAGNQTSAGTVTALGHVVSPGNGMTWTSSCSSELLTLSTSGTTTDTSANLLPANSIIRSVTARVTTTITTATSWSLGDPTTVTRFNAANTTLIAGTTEVGLAHIDQTGAAGPRQTSAAKVRVTTVGIPGAGALRLTACYDTFVPPTS